jgi:hypothetical protein
MALVPSEWPDLEIACFQGHKVQNLSKFSPGRVQVVQVGPYAAIH